MKKNIQIFVPATLGMLTAFGPFVTDFYLPVLPEMAGYFNTSASNASLSLTMGMIGLATGQIFIGPLTDKYGRKNILVSSMLLFCLSSFFCIFASDIVMFNAMRFLQGVAGAGGIVISKSIATDMYSGNQLAAFMAILGAINGIAPVCAPVIGGLMAGIASWQGVFGILLAVGFILMICSAFLRETLLPDMRIHKSLTHVYANLFHVFRNPCFALCVLSTMFCFFAFFGYIASSPFILQHEYGLSPFHFSLCFGINALMIGAGSAVPTRFKHQSSCLKSGALHLLLSSIAITVCLAVHFPLPVLMAAYIYMMIAFGLMQPSLTAIALDSERANAGAASAIFGASGFIAGAISSPLVAAGNIAISSGAVMTCGSLACLACILMLCKKARGEQVLQGFS